MNDLFHFLSLQDSYVRNVVLGTVLLAVVSSMVGTFTLLRKRALLGDAISHAILPGLCLAFLLYEEKNPLILLIGAFVTGWLSILFINFIKKHSHLSEDTAIAIVLSFFFGIGIVLLTRIQQMAHLSNKAGLNHFLFGSAIGLNETDLIVFGSVALLVLVCLVLFYKEFLLISFDISYAQSLGIPVVALELLLSTLTVLAIVIGIQTVGVVLMSAMLITPAAAARFWTHRSGKLFLWASLFGAIAAFSGTLTSYLSPSPTGPWIVMYLSLIALASFFFAPKRGIVTRKIAEQQFKNKILEENILKAMYQSREVSDDFFAPVTREELKDINENDFAKGIKRLYRHRFVKKTPDGKWFLSHQGKTKGERLTRIHRLWELYLTTYMNIADDHVHEDAESIEHIITPELEKILMKKLNYPSADPHDKKIPYKPKHDEHK